MRVIAGGVAALMMTSGLVSAGGLDRSGQGVNVIFEEGNVVQARFSYTMPTVEGTLLDTASGNVANDVFLPHFAYKHALTDRLDLALIYDQPFGADVEYDNTYFLSNFFSAGTGVVPTTSVLTAKAETDSLSAILRYKLEGGFSVMGGLRAQRAESTVTVPAAGDYSFSGESGTDVGYLIGVAWEKPEIAARVSLVYSSSIDHELDQTETINITPIGVVGPLFTNSTVTTPESVNLDFQTGIAADTLLFGTIRRAGWSATELTPGNYPTATGTLVSYSDDAWTYSLGVGRRFTDAFSGALTVGFEDQGSGTVSDLGPTDGFWSIGLGGTYTLDKAQISGGVRYSGLGDAVTDNGGVFEDNSAWSVGLQITYRLD